MSTLIRASQVTAADRMDFVREITAATRVPMEGRFDYRSDYQGEFRASGLGPMQVVVMDIMPPWPCCTARATRSAPLLSTP